MDMISAAEFERRMKEILERKPLDNKPESCAASVAGKHEDADDLMCKTLKSLGYSAGVEIFEKMEKWYA